MSLLAIKEEVGQLSIAERLELADFIAAKDQSSDEARRARIERRMKTMDQGRKITGDQLKAVHQALKALGV
jgi:hypothetical protein